MSSPVFCLLNFHSVFVMCLWQIQNGKLYTMYQVHKVLMSRSTDIGQNEMSLFHGTTPDAVVDIVHNGFNRSYSGKNAALYGKGVYFAKNASYATDYAKPDPGSKDRYPFTFALSIRILYTETLKWNYFSDRYMFIARVAVGDFHVGTLSTLVPDRKAGSLDRYHTTVNSLTSPSIFVAYHDAQAIPEYLIRFHLDSDTSKCYIFLLFNIEVHCSHRLNSAH